VQQHTPACGDPRMESRSNAPSIDLGLLLAPCQLGCLSHLRPDLPGKAGDKCLQEIDRWCVAIADPLTGLIITALCWGVCEARHSALVSSAHPRSMAHSYRPKRIAILAPQ